MNRVMCVLMVCVCAVLTVSGARAQEFSAAIVSTTDGAAMDGTVYVSKDKIRMEMPPAVTIIRLDKKLAWMLLDEQKMYMEMPVDARSLVSSVEKVPEEISRTLLGTETVDGRETEKYEVTYRDQEKNDTVYIWLSKELHFPLKSSSRDGSWIVEYSNVHEGPQPQEMFDVPGGYTKFDYGVASAEAAGN